jgi:Arc/MetJ-type ribon-helix-helix transcriptional regulator
MTIRLPDEYRDKIQEVAEKTGLKKSDIARLALRRFLDDFQEESLENQPAAMARDLIGVVSSNIKDLGTNHRCHILSRIQEHKT